MNTIRIRAEIFAVCCVGILILSLSGCGKSSPYEVVKLEGSVKWEGKPLSKEFSLEFAPTGGRQSSGIIVDDNGRFKAIYSASQDGVQKGKSRVRVLHGFGSDVPQEYQTLVEKYGYGTEGLEIDVQKTDMNFAIDFK